MASARDQMKLLENELARIRAEIDKLRVEEALLVKMIPKLSGNPPQKPQASGRARPPVKPVVLDIMQAAGASGATTAEVDERVRERVPSVAKDTVGSILSRLKSDGALAYVGERYYVKQHAPKDVTTPFEPGLRAVG